MLDIFIPHSMQSGNRFTSGRGAKWIKKAYREKWGNLIQQYAQYRFGLWHVYVTRIMPPRKVYAIFTRYMGRTPIKIVRGKKTGGGMERELDRDNLRQGFKLILDNLKPVISHAKNGKKVKRPRVLGLGWIYDDSPQWLESTIKQVKRHDRPGVGIWLTTDEAEYKHRLEECR